MCVRVSSKDQFTIDRSAGSVVLLFQMKPERRFNRPPFFIAHFTSSIIEPNFKEDFIMETRKIVKGIGGLAVGAGVGIIMGGACSMAAPVVGVGLLTKGAIAAGSLVLGSMVEDKAGEYFEQKVDEVCDMFKPKESEEGVDEEG